MGQEIDIIYSMAQLEEIKKGREEHLDVHWYESQEYMVNQMHEIRLGLEHEVDVSIYANPDYDFYQMKEIRLGLEDKLDVSSYAKIEYDNKTMKIIRTSIEEGLDISDYVKRGFRGSQLVQIYRCVKQNFHIGKMVTQDMHEAQLREIRKGLEHCINVYMYANVQYNWKQMHEIRLGLEHRIDAKKYAKATYLWPQMREVRLGLENGINIEKYNTLMFSAREMKTRRLRLEEELRNAPKPATKGEDGYYEYFIPYGKKQRSSLLADGAVDYSKIDLSNLVKAGESIAWYHPATRGEVGRDQNGNEIAGIYGKELPPLSGIGFHLKEDRQTYVADFTGLIEKKKDEIIVRPVLLANEALLSAKPELDFDGTIIVQGDVSEGFIHATDDIFVEGELTGGSLVAGRNVIVTRGARCTETGYIKAMGEISGDTFNNVILQATGDVRSNGLLNTNIDTSGAVKVSGTLSEVVGGNIQAENGIEVYNLGNINRIPTTVEIGMNENAKKRLADFRKQQFEGLSELKQLEESRKRIAASLNGAAASQNAKVNLVLEQLNEAIANKTQSMQKISYNIKSLESLKIRKSAPMIRIRGKAYAGCRLKIDGNVKIIDTSQDNITVKKKEGSIEIVDN